jgi:hypothetical protein
MLLTETFTFAIQLSTYIKTDSPMLKFLLILTIILYLVYKIGSFFFRAGVASRQFRESRKAPDTNSKPNQSGHIKGGEYVDYEEVK